MRLTIEIRQVVLEVRKKNIELTKEEFTKLSNITVQDIQADIESNLEVQKQCRDTYANDRLDLCIQEELELRALRDLLIHG